MTKKNKKSLKEVILKNKIIIVILVIFILIMLFSILYGINELKNKNILLKNNYTNSFFLEKNKKYALYNYNGKRLTKYIFDSYEQSSYKVFYVKKGKKYALIDENGKYVIKYNKCKYLTKIDDLYYCRNDKNLSIYNFKGNKIYSSKKTFNINRLGINSNVYSIETKDKYIIVNTLGKKLDEIKKVNNKTKLYEVNEDYDYLGEVYDLQTIYYNDKTYIYDYTSNNKIKLDGKYKIITKEKDKLILSKEGVTHRYYIYSNNKITGELSSVQCSKNNVKILDSKIMCYNDDMYQMFGLNGDLIENNIIKYKDENNYVKSDSETTYKNKFIIYNDERQIKIDGNSLENKTINNDVIIVKFKTSKDINYNYNFYNYNGKLLNKTPYNSIYYINEKDKYIVNENNKYYLINTASKKLSDKYKEINNIVNLNYLICKKNNKYEIINYNGKKLITNISKILDYNDKYIYVKIGNKYKIYNSNNKVIYKSNSKPNVIFSNNYFKIIKNNKTTYYSYGKGKKIR